MKYGSVCSGIEAATMAWHPLGWQPAFFSEIEKFPCAVLSHHYPHVPNHGDMTKFQEWPDHAIDLLVGGTPCQSFSVAGLRAGLADPRGNLMLTYLAIAARYRPRWLVWENVPGVLSSNGGRDFGTLLRGLAELGYGFAYRVLDAQFCRAHGYEWAVPQRRRRVFVVGYLGDWRRAAAVLFDGASLRGDPPPRREAGKATPAATAPSTDGCCSVSGCDRPAKKRGWCNTHYQRWRKHGFVADTPVNEPGRPDADRFWEKVAKSDGCWEWTAALNEKGYGIFWSGAEQRLVRAHRFAFEQSEGEIPEGLELDHKCRNRKCVRPDHLEPVTGLENTRRGNAGKHWAEKRGEYDVAPTISARPSGGGGLGTDFDLDASEDGTGRGTPIVPVAFNPQAGGKQTTLGYDPAAGTAGTLEVNQTPAVAFDMRGREGGAQFEGPHETANIRAASGGSSKSYVAESWAVRRLTPRECERLQGFPEFLDRVRIEAWHSSDLRQTSAPAETQNLRSPKSASIAGGSASPQPANPAAKVSSTSLPDRDLPVALNVLIDLERGEVQLRRAGRLIWSANTAAKPSASPLSMPLDAFVRLAAHMTQTAVPQTLAGRVELPHSISSSSPALLGSACVSVSGQEIEELASDAAKFGTAAESCTRSTMSPSGQSSPNSDWSLRTLSSCVTAAISSCIPSETRQASSYAVTVDLIRSFTAIPYRSKPAADGPRYKALGNSMAVNVMRVIGTRIAMVDAFVAQEAAA